MEAATGRWGHDIKECSCYEATFQNAGYPWSAVHLLPWQENDHPMMFVTI